MVLNMIGAALGFALAVNFAIEGNVHAALGWGTATVLWLRQMRIAR